MPSAIRSFVPCTSSTTPRSTGYSTIRALRHWPIAPRDGSPRGGAAAVEACDRREIGRPHAWARLRSGVVTRVGSPLGTCRAAALTGPRAEAGHVRDNILTRAMASARRPATVFFVVNVLLFPITLI